jgi:hypothetical protein
MRRKILTLIILMTIIVGSSASVLVKAAFSNAGMLGNVVALSNEDELVNQSRKLLEEALTEKKFYKYNIAYASMNKIKDANIKGELMGQLASISSIVYSDDINMYIGMLEKLVQSGGSGKLYDEIEKELRKSTLDDFDEGYLLGELTSWGKKLVYTPDYQLAVDRVVDAWKMLSVGTDANINEAIANAERAINGVRNKYGKEYLGAQLEQIRQQAEFTVIEIK